MSRVGQHSIHTLEHLNVLSSVPYFDQFIVVGLKLDHVARCDEWQVQKMNRHDSSRSDDEGRAGLADYRQFQSCFSPDRSKTRSQTRYLEQIVHHIVGKARWWHGPFHKPSSIKKASRKTLSRFVTFTKIMARGARGDRLRKNKAITRQNAPHTAALQPLSTTPLGCAQRTSNR
jgi:hypothetical protein